MTEQRTPAVTVVIDDQVPCGEAMAVLDAARDAGRERLLRLWQRGRLTPQALLPA